MVHAEAISASEPGETRLDKIGIPYELRWGEGSRNCDVHDRRGRRSILRRRSRRSG